MKYPLTLSLLLTVSTLLTAQVMETEYTISLGMQPAFMMDHEGADEKMVFKFLEDYYDEYGDVDRNRKASEWVCEECRISAISSLPLNVYFKVKEGKGQTTSYHFFDDGTRFISASSDTDVRQAIKDFLTEIKYGIRRKVLSEELKDQEDKLEDLNDDLEDLQDDNKDLHEDIEEYYEKIRKAEKDIEENLENQADKRMEIEKQRRAVQDLTDKINSVGRS